MGYIMTSKLSHSILLFTVIGEFFLPWILCRYYEGYNSKTMAMFQNTVLKYEGLWERRGMLKSNQRLDWTFGDCREGQIPRCLAALQV